MTEQVRCLICGWVGQRDQLVVVPVVDELTPEYFDEYSCPSCTSIAIIDIPPAANDDA